MIPMTLAHIAEVTGGSIAGTGDLDPAEIVIDGPVVTDSREAEPGSLYIARVGEHADGHQYVGGAAAKGAVAALVTMPVDGLPHVLVTDVQDAFVALARHLVDSRGPSLNVIGITGSSGKTSTKDLLGAVLAQDGETIAPQGSYNSEVGVPLTVCRITPTTAHLVVEMGARGAGHVRYLTEIAPPRIGAVLNVGHAHVGEFGSLDAVARAKSELVEALPADGVAVLNADDPRVAAMAPLTSARVVFVGESPRAQIRAEQVRTDDRGRASFDLVTPVGTAPVTLALVGRHHVGNALTVAAIALESGLALDQIATALAATGPVSRWRMEVSERADGVTVVNDAYNANPDSMRAALRAVADMAVPGRRWAVLGAMLEMGEESEALHEQVGREAANLGFNEVLAVGKIAAPIAAGAMAAADSTHAEVVADTDGAWDVLSDRLRPGDVVLFKSSRDAGLRWLAERVVEVTK
ncbi:UDP-N-acetylmuramoyl-tripeptide--D-alanyl-D-alanine ligase [Janibacter sp. GXQ6167]|uniref:UDP-N-acetylmuramoyl-tripeptide--D-alanyl-D- alanine ligase n=1 Tax=Janibacter sp. GXQ6167 TaxID=3240791 RepID=UPI003525FE1D